MVGVLVGEVVAEVVAEVVGEVVAEVVGEVVGVLMWHVSNVPSANEMTALYNNGAAASHASLVSANR